MADLGTMCMGTVLGLVGLALCWNAWENRRDGLPTILASSAVGALALAVCIYLFIAALAVMP